LRVDAIDGQVGLGAAPARYYFFQVMFFKSRCFALSLSLTVVAACSKCPEVDQQTSHGAAANRGALVARIGNVKLHEDDVQRAMAREPGASPERFKSPEARRDFIDGLIRFELLAQAAERAGLTKDPDAVHAQQQIAVTKLVNQTLGAVAAPETLTEADVEREYQARQASDFTLPPAAQVRHIHMKDPQLAERVAIQAKALAPGDDAGFASLAAKTSEDAATRASGGDLGFIDKGSHLSPDLVSAALNMKTPGEVVGPLAIDSGYEILRLVSLRAAAVSPFSSVEEPIRQRLYRERRAKALEDFIARLRKETSVQVGDQRAAVSEP
jgi:peptidyl-prolyl cis-trans isomerase C